MNIFKAQNVKAVVHDVIVNVPAKVPWVSLVSLELRWNRAENRTLFFFSHCLSGPQGFPGVPGDRGLKGPSGRSGNPGLSGEKGDRGQYGNKGERVIIRLVFFFLSQFDLFFFYR